MYRNLSKLLNERNVSTAKLADFLGVAQKTAYNKTVGETDFTLKEARRTMLLFPEYSMDYVFADSDLEAEPAGQQA